MKATVIEPIEPWNVQQIVLFSACALFCIMVLSKMFFNSVSNYATVFSFLKQMPGIEVEDAGETNHSNLFSVSVSATTQHFNLNTFVDVIRRMGCAVLSTADTDNPSYRTITVEVPKNGGGIGLKSIMFLGILIGIGMFSYYHTEEIYNTFPVLKTLIDKYV